VFPGQTPDVFYSKRSMGHIDNFRLDPGIKGVPSGSGPLDRLTIAQSGWRLFDEDLALPVAVLRNSVLKQNSTWMKRFLTGFNASIAPHGKTTMSPQLFAKQLEDGCWGITLATCYQIQVARSYDIKRILLANQVVGRREIDYLVAEMVADPNFDLYCFVDSPEGVLRLAQGMQRSGLGRPIKVLIEVGITGGRCGVRTTAQGTAVARAVREAGPHLSLVGIAGFEGLYQYRWNDDRVKLVRSFLRRIIDLATETDRFGLFEGDKIILSAGGSAYYDLVAELFSKVKLSRPVHVLTRSGCYLTHDSGIYHKLQSELDSRIAPAPGEGHLGAALEVWTYVLSRPESGLSILSAGRRDFGTDAGNPVPLKWSRPPGEALPLTNCEVIGVSDQHAHLQVPADHPLQVGDMVGLGVSHPCTTFDKWRLIYLVDDEYRIVDAIQTFF
jgi:D-serine deaminase-like pyridoxal phosphate-dependent protein